MKEIELVVQATRVNTLSKLTFADSRRFDALVRDVFPAVEFSGMEQEKLESALQEVCREMHLEVIPAQVCKTSTEYLDRRGCMYM